MGRKERRLVVWLSSSSTASWSRSETGGKSIATVRTGENLARAAATVQPMMTPEPGEENGAGSFDAVGFIAAVVGDDCDGLKPGRGRKTVARAGMEMVASGDDARTPVRSITVAPELWARRQFSSVSRCEPVKKTKRASSK